MEVMCVSEAKYKLANNDRYRLYNWILNAEINSIANFWKTDKRTFAMERNR